MPVTERSTDVETSPAFCGGRKISEVEQVLLWEALREDPQGPSRPLMDRMAERQVLLRIGVRQVNRWRVRWQGPRRKGRPRKIVTGVVAAPWRALATVSPLPYVGMHLWAAWLEEQTTLGAVVALLQQAIAAYKKRQPAEDFPLLHHKPETLRRRWAALWYAPLLGVAKLTEFDVRETPLATLVGRGYQSS